MNQKMSQHRPVLESRKQLYHDQYASVTFNDAIPCIKIKINGVPQSSEHYQFIHLKVMDFIFAGKKDYVDLRLLTDNSEAGLVLDEDIDFYETTVVPAMERAGIRYHAIVLPEKSLLRFVLSQRLSSTKKVKVAFFDSARRASYWLRSRY
jgi:hypothetical protein